MVMGYRIRPRNIREELVAFNDELREAASRFTPLKRAIEGYINSTNRLQGRAYDASREYWSSQNMNALDQEVAVLNNMIDVNNRHIAYIDSNVGQYELLDQNQLESSLASLDFNMGITQGLIDQANSWGGYTPICGRSADSLGVVLNIQQGMYDLRDRQLADLMEYVSVTNNLYDEVHDQLREVERILLRLERATFNPSTGRFDIPSFDDARVGTMVGEVPEYEPLRLLLLSLTNEDGTHNWDEIHEILSRPYDAISEIEYETLAMVFLTLESDEDLTRFIQYLADPVMVPSITPGSWLYNQDGIESELLTIPEFRNQVSEITRDSGAHFDAHTICPNRIAMIQSFLILDTAIVLDEKISLNRIEEGARYTELMLQYEHLIERSTLLGVVHSIANQDEILTDIRSYRRGIGGDANGPLITIESSELDAGGHLVRFNDVGISKIFNPDSNDHHPSIWLTFPENRTIFVSSAQNGTNITAAVNENVLMFLDDDFPLNLNTNFGAAGLNYVWKTIRNSAFTAGAAALTGGKSKVIQGIAKYLTTSGLVAWDANSSTNSRESANQGVQSYVRAIVDINNEASFYLAFGARGITVATGTENQVIAPFPTSRTFNQIEAINQYLRSEISSFDINNLPQGLQYPIDLDDFFEFDNLYEFWRNIENNSSYTEITNIRTIIENDGGVNQ